MRRNWITLNIGCLATYAGVYIEKGMGLINSRADARHAGRNLRLLPDDDGVRVAAGIFAAGSCCSP